MLKIHGEAVSRFEREQIMRRLFTVMAILVLLAPAIGCESCLFRGARAQPAPACAPPCDRGCSPSCVPGGAGRRLPVVSVPPAG